MMTTINAWLLIASAMLNPQSTFFSQNALWVPANDQQCRFLQMIDDLEQDCSLLNGNELQSWVSRDHIKLNQIAEEHGIPIAFESFPSNEFGCLAILNLNMSWLRQPMEILYQFKKVHNKVKGLSFAQDFEVVYSSVHNNPLVKIKTQSGDILYLTVASRNHKNDCFALSQHIERIRNNIQERSKAKKQHYDCVIIPQFVYQDTLDASWLIGMECCEPNKSNSYVISSPAYTVKMQCDVNGCRVKAGVGLTYIPISTEQKTLMIDRPFYFWVERHGSRYPLIEGTMNGDFLVTKEEAE
jgi:hypothetical protein